jgi:hypothetical protein
MLTSERCSTLHGTLPIATAGTMPSPAAASSVTLSPSPKIVACNGEDAEKATEVINGVNSLEATYLHPLEARQAALIDATETVTAGTELNTVKAEGSMG